MLLRVIKKILFIFFLIVAELAFVRALGWPLYLLSPVLVALTFVGVLDNFKRAIVYGVVFGLIIDLFSASFFGITAISFVLALFVIDKVFNKVFTNKSLYSIVFLVIIAQIVVNYISNVFFFIQTFIFDKAVDYSLLFNLENLKLLGYAILVNVVLSSIIFLIFHSFSNRFKTILIR